MKSLISLLLVIVTLNSFNCEELVFNSTYSPPASLPKLPTPKYEDETGEIEWFPRIIGGTNARAGEFPGKVSIIYLY